ncbi:MAG: hypothetical protein B6242_07350 [Anaerolineaceae bacterium 4572_78]|nr:MAG: hypothetical protein B6242_07350 [Anaerolineaceae bacterium 4572_78]
MKRRKNMETYNKITLIISLIFVLGLVACNSSPPPASTSEVLEETTSLEEIELVIWSAEHGMYLKEQFEIEHPNVTVIIENQGWDQVLHQNLLNAIQAGTAPDIVIGESYFQQLAEAGYLLPVDEAIADIKDDIIPGTYKGAEYNGALYGVPAFTGVFVFERNCKVITSAGLDCDTPPHSWSKLLEHAQTITEKGDGDYYGYSLQGPVGPLTGGLLRIAVFLAQTDASLCRNDCTEPYFNNPKALPVMTFLRQLNQYTPPGLTANPEEGQVYVALFHGQSAYQIAGSWHPDWAKREDCEDCRYSAVPIPQDGHPASIIVGNVIYAALKETKHPDVALEFIKLVVREDMQEQVYPKLGRLPATRSALTKLRLDIDPATQTFIDELLNNPDLRILPQWRKNPQKIWRIYNEMLEQVLSTNRPGFRV